MANIILASSSPRRKQLLEQVGLVFDTFSPDIDESVLNGETAQSYVLRLAETKAKVVLERFPEAIVIAADTSLSLNQYIIGKPESKQHAFEIWSALSGREHRVITGVCVASKNNIQTIAVHTQVEIQHLSPEDMEQYWDTGEPIGKAGAYAIQGYAAQYIPRIVGSYSNVVGLPLHETMQLLNTVMKSG
ncbi:septum formation inhibitor Maf [Acinetobacter sp. 194]|uniref:Maf family nucleotide pyrophosphatase n=1 Tax=Acinetobacter shaoyimingii TaxID=2715164 RepID=UPI001408E22B|nr:Maf family nucleotide pyrophosphatase [Acinetobacter shaoyimingii]NHB57672.1 septum formation inhibitor Maf [Acinetobacter shaoyimingii]